MPDYVKVSFVGDIMCEKPMQLYAERHGFSSFEKIFSNTRELFEESDYVVGNLETVFGGAKGGYTRELYNFNTPDQFAAALSRSGIDMVTTATNHSLDRGLEGLIRTISVLEKNGIEHTGTYSHEEDSRIFVKKVGNTRIAILNYTYGTNVHETGVILSDEQLFHLNLLKPQTYHLQTYVGQRDIGAARKAFSGMLGKFISTEQKMRIKQMLHLPYNLIRIDHLDMEELDVAYFEQIKTDVVQAREKADIVVACIHMGGQFNPEPGDFTKYVVQKLSEYGVDAIIANHPHIVQKFNMRDNIAIAYSLGNYSISPLSVYLLRDYKPEYSIMLHLYIDSAAITGISFSILKIVEEKTRGLTVFPVDKLYEIIPKEEQKKLVSDIQFIFQRFTGMELEDNPVRHEYMVPGFF